MCLGAASYPTQVAKLGMDAIMEAKEAKLSTDAAGEASLASTTSESGDESGSAGLSPGGDQGSSSGSAGGSSDEAHKSRAPGATRDELVRLQDKQRQVMQLLRTSAFPCSSEGGSSRHASKASVAPVASPNKSAPRFAEVRERYLRCVKSSQELEPAPVLPQLPARAPARGGAIVSEQGSEDEWELQVIMAQAAANHIAEMGALRKLQEGLVAQAEHKAVQAELAAVLQERDALASQLHALQAAHKALTEELQAQGEKEAGQPKKHAPVPPRAGLSFAVVAAAAGAAAVLRAMHAKC